MSDACSMVPLVEARQSRRLGPTESLAVEEHLETCDSCAALARDLARFRALAKGPPLVLPAHTHTRGRARLLRAASVAAPSKRGRLARGLPIAFAVAALAIALWIGVFRAQPRALVLEPIPPLPLRSITIITAREGSTLDEMREGGLHLVRLSQGIGDFSVRPLRAGERFVVRTSDAEVEVRGTVFDVEADHDRITRVGVEEGEVEVRFRDIVARVQAGHEWRRPVDAPPPPELASSAGKPSTATPATSREARGPAATATDEGSKSFADGVHLVERGDFRAAAERLEEFRAKNPRDARSEDAMFLIVLALKRAGRDADAALAARRYLDEYPNGARRAEAQALAAP